MYRKDLCPVDEIGWKILEELQKNARISFKQLAAQVNLSPTAVIERVKRMEEEGVIVGYRAMIDPRRVGFNLTALLSISTSYGNPEQIMHDALSEIPEVTSCWSITGTNDFLLEIHVPSLEFLEELLTELAQYGKATTSIVLPKSVQKRMIMPPRATLAG